MSIAQPLIEELTQEAAATRILLERVPEAHWEWTPHPKSMSIAYLASHMAESLGWTAGALAQDELEMDMDAYQPFVADNKAAMLSAFDDNLAAALEVLKGQSDERMLALWRMTAKGTALLEMPRVAVVRVFVLNHLIHHRGQLTVYLRLKDVPLPSIYGPTADEPM